MLIFDAVLEMVSVATATHWFWYLTFIVTLTAAVRSVKG